MKQQRLVKQNTRRHRRFTVDLEAVVHSRHGQLRARTRDVSRSGICLITGEGLTISEPLDVELVLAFGDNKYSEPLHLVGRVVWCTAINASFQIGAVFDELTEEQDSFLEMFLHYLDGTLAPSGVASEEVDDDPLPPDDKDDPFRYHP